MRDGFPSPRGAHVPQRSARPRSNTTSAASPSPKRTAAGRRPQRQHDRDALPGEEPEGPLRRRGRAAGRFPLSPVRRPGSHSHRAAGTPIKSSLGTAIHLPRNATRSRITPSRHSTRRRPFDTTTAPNPHDPRGSIWRRWDLHVHTPKSIVRHYGPDNDTTWERYLTDIEALPNDIRVLGINDYLFIDGYERVLAAKDSGRLPNIDLILPVVELRLDKFGGTDTDWSKVNYHIIFSNHLSPTTIRDQFLSTLTGHYTLAPGQEWKGFLTETALRELGQRINETAPANKQDHRDPLTIAFNHVTFKLDEIKERLTNTAFKHQHLTAVGKAEWASMRWDSAALDKRSIIEAADFVFTAAETPEACVRGQQTLHNQRVNTRLLHCSDAHYFSDTDQNNRIGHCHTWIKADPTFDGLRQVRQAADERIYLGDTPPKQVLVQRHPTKFLTAIDVHRKPNATLSERWFDNHVPLNPDLVAVIGNKGMGKSALTDIIALTSNSDAQQDRYGFLTENKFRDRRDNKARHFTATITWESGETSTPRSLDENVPTGTVSMVRYIPQHYFEDLCNETSNAALLQRELRNVIFSNLSSAERGRYTDLDELLTSLTSQVERHIDELRGELLTINRDIVILERELTAKRRRELEDQLQQQEAALAAHDANKTSSQEPPTEATSTPALDAAREVIHARTTAITDAEVTLQDQYELRTIATNVKSRLQTLRDTIERTVTGTASDLERLGLTFQQFLPASLTLTPLEMRETAIRTAIATSEEQLRNLRAERSAAQETVTAEQETLAAPARAYQQYLNALHAWEEQRRAIIGTPQTAGTIEYLKARLTTTRNAQAERLANLHAERLRIARTIHEQLLRITAFQRTLYAPVADRLANHEVVRAQLNVNFTAKLVDTGLAEEFTKRINRVTSVMYRDEHAMRDQLDGHDLNLTDDLERFLTTTLDRLHRNQHGEMGDTDDLQRQLRKGEEAEGLYNYLYAQTYLEPRYALRIKDRELAQLTPGERGSLLLVFYLVIDQDDRPLIIDQPEENLDNQSVFQLLAPCIKEAKQRRQLIMVTHNPNLAVVCNAEQIIWCKINKDTDHTVQYETGSLENPEINGYVVDVLEGTRPAFDDRGHKYHETR
jgi:ABC-type lipoprotein export system ATPase subunit